VGGIVPSSLGTHSFAQAEVDLQWTVCDFGRTAGRHDQAISRERIAGLQLTRAQQTVAFDTISAYLNLLLAQASARVQVQAVRQAQATLDDTRARWAGGVADRDAVLRADVQLSEAQAALIAAQQVEFDALANLNFTLGRNVTLPLRLIDWTSRPSFQQSLVECLQTAVAYRQEVGVAKEAVAAARHGLEATEADFLPYVFIRLSEGHVDGENVVTGWHEGAAIHFNQEIYAGGRRKGEERSAEADVRSAVAQAQTIFDTISLQVNQAFRSVANAREQILLAETAVVQARENLRLIQVKYKNSTATPTDVVDAETAATRSEQRLVSAGYDYLAALARLDYAMGAPPGCLIDPAPKPAQVASPAAELSRPRMLPAEADKKR
jgi:outer membrane protein TolC